MDKISKCIFYGDSNTYGYDPADYMEGRYALRERWTSIAAEQLKERFLILPEGMNGRKLPDLGIDQSYLLKLIRTTGEGDLFCTMLGTNDILNSGRPDARLPIRKMEKYLSFLTGYLLPRQILILAPPYIGDGTETYQLIRLFHSESVRMNQGFAELCRRTGIPFADTAGWDIGLSYDRVHFSADGHRQFAEKIVQLLTKQ